MTQKRKKLASKQAIQAVEDKENVAKKVIKPPTTTKKIVRKKIQYIKKMEVTFILI